MNRLSTKDIRKELNSVIFEKDELLREICHLENGYDILDFQPASYPSSLSEYPDSPSNSQCVDVEETRCESETEFNETKPRKILTFTFYRPLTTNNPSDLDPGGEHLNSCKTDTRGGSITTDLSQPSVFFSLPVVPFPEDLEDGKGDAESSRRLQVRQDAWVLNRVSQLRSEGLLASYRIPKSPDLPRVFSGWDYLLKEMRWMSRDYQYERRWKIAVAKVLGIVCDLLYQTKKKEN
eukprot:TRINITY_DN6155_c0_g2_i6.p1 TRINITY_DN6155_c0_g2~~TRINITY_DN6155_c0_g2_i6.p1  ORF type:complete len:236 (+),score=29.65 TRINITY_DN6155_c0_g2_i6:112-819(+)